MYATKMTKLFLITLSCCLDVANVLQGAFPKSQVDCVDTGCQSVRVKVANKSLILYKTQTSALNKSSCYQKYHGPKQLEILVDVCNKTLLNSEFSLVDKESTNRVKKDVRKIYYCPVSGQGKLSLSGRERPLPQSSSKRYLSLLVIVDRQIYQIMLNDVVAIREWVEKIYFHVKEYYHEELNIEVSIDSVNVLNESAELLQYESMKDTIISLSMYQEQLRKSTNSCFLVGNVLTKRVFTMVGHNERIVLGFANTKSICGPAAAAIVTVVDHLDVQRIAKTVIHEILHILGVYHDDESCSCESPTGCMMGPKDETGDPTEPLSNCSLEYYQDTQNSKSDFCMVPERYCRGLVIKAVPVSIVVCLVFRLIIAAK